MTNLHGDGTKGKRLWIRSPNDTWIEVPTGKGQDEHVASVNVWDGSRWMTVAWAWWYLIQEGINITSVIHQKIPSFEVRAPGVTYEGKQTPTDLFSSYNPTYVQSYYDPYEPTAGNYQFTDPNENWVRLFHVAKRNDPNWRIVPVGYSPLPLQVPNRTTDLLGLFRIFWPCGGVLYSKTDEFHLVTTERRDIDVGRTFSPAVAYYSERTQNPVPFSADQPDSIQRFSSTLDVAAIRTQTRAIFPQQNAFFSGQYAHIDDMKVKRIYAAMYYQVGVLIQGTTPNPGTLNAFTWKMYYKYQATDVQEFEITNQQPVFNWPAPVTVRCPTAHSSSADGAIVAWEGIGSDFTNINQYGDTWYYNNSGTVDQIEFLATEDNITFWLEVEGIPEVHDPDIHRISVEVSAQPLGYTVQYATDGHDVPEDKHKFTAPA